MDDIVQETFVAAYKNLGKFDTSKDFGKWVRGILRFKYLEWMRKKKELPLDESILEAIDAQYTILEYASKDNDGGLIEALKACMGRLKGPALQVVEFFYFDKQSCSVIAETMNSSDVAVRQRLRRVRGILAECILHYKEDAVSESGVV